MQYSTFRDNAQLISYKIKKYMFIFFWLVGHKPVPLAGPTAYYIRSRYMCLKSGVLPYVPKEWCITTVLTRAQQLYVHIGYW